MKGFSSLTRLFFGFSFALLLFTGLVLARGDRTHPKVERSEFSKNRILLTFNRDMDLPSVEKNWKLDPPAPGKFSGVGRRLAYTFEKPLRAGQRYRLTLGDARDTQGKPLEPPFTLEYQTPPPQLFYLGNEGAAQGRLIRYDLTFKASTPLSPEGLSVKGFLINPNQHFAYLLGGSPQAEKGLEEHGLYELNLEAGILKTLVAPNPWYVFRFALSPSGEWLAFFKGEKKRDQGADLLEPGDLWLMNTQTHTISRFWKQGFYSSDLFFSPDSRFLMTRTPEGQVVLAPLEPDEEGVVYLEKLSTLFGFNQDGSAILFTESTENLFDPDALSIRKSNGETDTFSVGSGRILQMKPSPQPDEILYLMSPIATSGRGMELEPSHLYRYFLSKKSSEPLTDDPAYWEGFFGVSSDNRWTAFERYPVARGGLFFEDQLKSQVPAQLWIYDSQTKQVEDLHLQGTQPFLN